MSGIRHWVSSAALLFIQRISIQAIAAVSQLIIVAFLTPREYGEYVVLTTIGQLLSAFMHWGVHASIVRYAAVARENPTALSRVLWQHARVLVFLNAMTFLTLALLGFVASLAVDPLKYLSDGITLAWAAALVVSMALAVAAESIILYTLMAIDRVAWGALLGGGLRGILVLTALLGLRLLGPLHYNMVVWIQVGASVVAALVALLVYIAIGQRAREATDVGIADDQHQTEFHDVSDKDIVMLSLSVMGSFLLSQARFAAEPILLRTFFGLEVTGIVTAARKITQLVNLSGNTVSGVLAPMAVRAKSTKQLRELRIVVSMTSIAIMGLCLALFLVFLDVRVLTAIFGVSYAAAHGYLLVMLALLFVRSVFGFPTHLLLVKGGQNDVLISYVFDIIASLLVLTAAGRWGSPMAAVVGIGLVQILQFGWLWSRARKHANLRTDLLAIWSR